MKKLIAIALCAAVCLTTGCGSKSDTTSNSASNPFAGLTSSTGTSSGGTSAAGTSTTNTSTANSSTTNSSTAGTSDTSVPTVSTPNAENGNFVRGKWNGNTFTSDFFGYTFTLGSDWNKETDDKLAQRNGIADMSDAALTEAVEKSNTNTVVYEVFATNSKIGSFGAAVNKHKGKTLETYVQENANGIKASSAFKDTRVDKVNIAGKQRDCIYTTFVSGTSEVREIMIAYKNGDYFSLITIGVLSDDSIQDVVDSIFSPAADAPDNSAPAGTDGRFVRGKWNGNTFTSDFFGITINIDDNCQKETDEQLAARNGIADMSDAVFNDKVEKSNANTAVYEIFLQRGLGATAALAYNRYSGYTLDEYVQANANGLEFSSSFKDVKVDTIKIAGKDQPCVYTTYVSGLTEVKEIMVMYKNGDYFAILTIGALSDAELRNMIEILLG